MLFDTVAEYDAEIVIVQSNIKRQMLVGAQSSNDSGGSSRSMTEVDFSKAQSYLRTLKQERKILNDEEGCVSIVGMGW